MKLYRKYRRTKRTVKISVVLLTLGFALLLSGCGAKQQEQFHDADRGTENSAPADTIAMPDGYGNDAPYGAVAVVPNDLTCPKEK